MDAVLGGSFLGARPGDPSLSLEAVQGLLQSGRLEFASPRQRSQGGEDSLAFLQVVRVQSTQQRSLVRGQVGRFYGEVEGHCHAH